MGQMRSNNSVRVQRALDGHHAPAKYPNPDHPDIWLDKDKRYDNFGTRDGEMTDHIEVACRDF